MKKIKNEIFYTFGEVPKVAEYLVTLLDDFRVIALKGELGAGKTTLVRSALRFLGVDEIIASPTFTYMNAYRLPNNKMLFHFDLYRIESDQEFIFAGFDEYLEDEDAWVIIEWPEKIAPLLARTDVCNVEIKHISQDQRSMIISC